VRPLHDRARRAFASDNEAGAHPEVLQALVAANGGHQLSYGADDYTARLQDVIGRHFGAGAVAYPVLNGTGANVLALQSVVSRWGAVICAEGAHVDTDESTAPAVIGGFKLLAVPTPDGKLTPELIDRRAVGFGDEHRAQPQAVTITQATEVGTAYTAAEVRAIADRAHELGLVLHMDGARIANAAAHLGASLAELTSEAGVDVLSFGGTKNGLLFGEMVVVLNPDRRPGIAADLCYLRKLDLQLVSKTRFVSAQLLALLEADRWRSWAAHANAMAQRLAAGVRDLAGVEIVHPVQSNAVFARLASDVADQLRQRFAFYDWDRRDGVVRWMCAFDVDEADVDAFLAELRRLLGRPAESREPAVG